MDGIGLDGPDEDKTAHCEEGSKIDNEVNLNRNVMSIKFARRKARSTMGPISMRVL